MGPIASGALKAGVSLLGGLFGRKKQPQGVDFAKLRNDAQAAGFNPLTALMATGGAGYSRSASPALSSASFVQEALERGIDTWFNQVERDKEAENIKKAAHLTAKANATSRSLDRFGYNLTQTRPYQPRVTWTPVPALAANPTGLPPKPRDVRLMPVRLPDGQERRIPYDVATRLGIGPWGQVTPGDYAELVGEIRGEAESTVMFQEIGQNMGIPFFQREEHTESPALSGEYKRDKRGRIIRYRNGKPVLR